MCITDVNVLQNQSVAITFKVHKLLLFCFDMPQMERFKHIKATRKYDIIYSIKGRTKFYPSIHCLCSLVRPGLGCSCLQLKHIPDLGSSEIRITALERNLEKMYSPYMGCHIYDLGKVNQIQHYGFIYFTSMNIYITQDQHSVLHWSFVEFCYNL